MAGCSLVCHFLRNGAYRLEIILALTSRNSGLATRDCITLWSLSFVLCPSGAGFPAFPEQWSKLFLTLHKTGKLIITLLLV